MHKERETKGQPLLDKMLYEASGSTCEDQHWKKLRLLITIQLE